MTKKDMLRELDRLRTEIDKPEPDLRDVMDKLEAIERRIGDIERRNPVVVQPVTYPVWTQPVQPYWYWSPLYGSSSSSSTFALDSTTGDI